MLQLLRRYQKIIFIIVTVTVILTFSFFGTYSAVAAGPKKEKDHKIGKSLDGSAIYAKEIDDLVRFLRTDALDAPILEELSRVNLFNDGVIKKDIFETGIGLMLLQHYYPVFKDELKGKMQKFSSFQPYRHPEAPFVSLESIWRQFVPEYFEHYKKFQASKGGEIDREKLEMVVALYLDQCAFPPSAARQLLSYLQQQYRGVVPFDPYVQSGELALFHAKTAEDWFGVQFIEALAHFIHNASVYAHEQGYRVSREEAKASLMKIGMDNAKMVAGSQIMTQAEFAKYYARALQMLQLDEKGAIDLWQKVMLFRRLFNDVGHSVFLDKTLYEQFHQFASNGVQIDLYTMQPALRLSNERDLYKFELYLQAVADKGADKGDPLGLPAAFASEAEVMKRFPELMQKRFLIKMASVRRGEVERQIGLRYLMNWQLEDSNWVKLQREFASLAKLETKEKEARYEFLEAMAPEKREEVDRYSMTMILNERPDFIREALMAKDLETREIALPYKGDYSPLLGIQEPARLMTLLETAYSDKGGLAEEKLGFYSQDDDIFYKIAVAEVADKAETMTFQEADERGILDALLDRDLKIKYDALKASGSKLLVGVESFEGAQDLVGRILFSAKLDAMKKVLGKRAISLSGKSEEEVADLCAKCRFYNYLEMEKSRLQNGDEYVGPLFVSQDQMTLSKRAPFDHQFRIEKKNEEYMRKQDHAVFDSRVLKMDMDEWSQILVGGRESALFFQVKEKIIDEKAMQKGLQDGRYILSNEAKRHLMSRLLQEMDDKNVVIATSMGDL